MTDPNYPRRDSVPIVRDVLVVLAAVAATIYFLVDDTPEPWLVRLAWAAAIVAGFALALTALVRLYERR